MDTYTEKILSLPQQPVNVASTTTEAVRKWSTT
jgi:hypothetical protein